MLAIQLSVNSYLKLILQSYPILAQYFAQKHKKLVIKKIESK